MAEPPPTPLPTTGSGLEFGSAEKPGGRRGGHPSSALQDLFPADPDALYCVAPLRRDVFQRNRVFDLTVRASEDRRIRHWPANPLRGRFDSSSTTVRSVPRSVCLREHHLDVRTLGSALTYARHHEPDPAQRERFTALRASYTWEAGRSAAVRALQLPGRGLGERGKRGTGVGSRWHIRWQRLALWHLTNQDGMLPKPRFCAGGGIRTRTGARPLGF